MKFPNINFRNMFKTIFNRNPTSSDGRAFTRFVSLNNEVNLKFAAEEENYDSLFVRVCVDAIAENAAKLRPKVQRIVEGHIIDGDSRLQRILELEPNPYMNSFDFLYKVVTLWATDNNVFIYIKRDDKGNVEGLYPIAYAATELLSFENELYAKFTFKTGFTMTVAYSDLCHLRRFFGTDDIFGSDNDNTLGKQVGLLNIINKGFAAAVNSNNRLKGILKVNLNLHNDEIKKAQEEFIENYLRIDNSGGIAALDNRMEYIELHNNTTMADDSQMAIVREDIMKYYHVSEKIILANYNEDEWNAFYESVIEPIAIRLGLELTRKIFTERELSFGNKIIFESNRLQYASTQSKIELLKELMPMGILEINEGREIFNMAPVEGGNKRILSLNYIDADLASEYQLNRGNTEGNKGGE